MTYVTFRTFYVVVHVFHVWCIVHVIILCAIRLLYKQIYYLIKAKYWLFCKLSVPKQQ